MPCRTSRHPEPVGRLMPDFDILSTRYGGQGTLAGGPDILSDAYTRPQVGPNGQPLPNGAPGQPQAQQPQSAPMSGLMAGVLGLPQYRGAIPGAVYGAPGQVPGQAGQAPVAQGSGLAAALGIGASSLFNGVVGGGR